jgi:hypothetical protein
VDLVSLLRADSKRPRHCRAAEHAKEFTSPHLPPPAKDHEQIVNRYHTQATPVCDIKPKQSGDVLCDLADVRFGSEADIQRRSTNVRFTINSGHRRQRLGHPLSARNVRCRRRRQRLWRNPLDLAPAVWENDNSFKLDFDAQSAAFIGAQRVRQALSEQTRERA